MADPQLVQYIAAQLQAGYTAEQVRASLAANGYPPLVIEEAMRDLHAPPSNPQVASFAQQLMQQGYLPVQAIAALVQQGFSQKDARAAVKQVYGVNPPGGSKHVVIVVFLLLAVVVAGGGSYLFLHPSTGIDPGTDGPPVVIPPSDQEITAMIINTALAQGKDPALRQCYSRLAGDARETCIMDIAVLEGINDDTLCDSIKTPETHDTCLRSFLNTNRFESVCSRMMLVANQQSCDNIKALRAA